MSDETRAAAITRIARQEMVAIEQAARGNRARIEGIVKAHGPRGGAKHLAFTRDRAEAVLRGLSAAKAYIEEGLDAPDEPGWRSVDYEWHRARRAIEGVIDLGGRAARLEILCREARAQTAGKDAP